ncbi:MAG: histidinol-phosphatase, partial [Oscillospiraceae bacterium]|nr:histidinol-phosphatase [Oscillospiraceae bacterium]
NTTGNCAAFCRAAERYGLLALPGMELTTAEEAHVVCLFPDLEAAGAFGALVREMLPPIRNNPAVFGPQVCMDGEDCVLGEETAFLAGASSIGIYETAALAASFGGVAYPAHIDRPSFSLLANLGLWDPGMGFPVAEVSRRCPPGLFSRPDLRGVPHFDGSDAHYLDQILDAHQYMALPERSAQAVLAWLRAGGPAEAVIS